jgi:hypothetical protein
MKSLVFIMLHSYEYDKPALQLINEITMIKHAPSDLPYTFPT